MNKDINIYRGKVKIAYKKGKNILKQTTHNKGLSDMSLMFAKAITGNLDYSSDIPRLIDIGYIVPSATSSEYTYSNGVWMSILNNPVNIGGRQYKYDQELENWVAVLTSTVYYSDLNGGILDNVLAQAEPDPETGESYINLKVRLCSYDLKDRKYLAEIDISPEEIREIRDSTSAIFSWYTELLYNEENSSDNVESDVVVS